MLGVAYIGHSSMRHVRNLMKNQLYTYLGSEGRLVLPLSVAEFNGLCMQFEKKHFGSLVWTPNPNNRMLDTVFIGYKFQQGLSTIPGKTLYIRLAKHAFAILYIILGKTLPNL